MFVEHKERGEVTETPANTLDEASKLLLKAAWLIETHGHAKGSLRDGSGALCALGALLVAENRWAEGFPSDVGFVAYRRVCPEGLLSSWNNAAERTAGEVVSTFRRAALGL